ncbi:hypothetical protein Rru_A2756 [Rhodospirillum rubrum ATCC 11170]|uniref:Uncharacterized protein n=1 Tax=Rhodospirillum rubrum (strain ATCC 11170 / ATH 1.1.1 / DSM 467 / LMG 4362 / NCIMB 8255 / S1) TaxID=269796 RepID=Q2RQP2_RHORT|nr:hypothetical protein Rru_A2756 [Rhodospirillum rubrum ATCC 11170]MBK5955227.1 hypothetical protein [Rhodospirillum rubrum]HAP99924.1 hypothetical protein [Rhodospirillum rubrum]HCF19565.1 hypothetical protein [Rhodospirillum rubrum]
MASPPRQDQGLAVGASQGGEQGLGFARHPVAGGEQGRLVGVYHPHRRLEPVELAGVKGDGVLHVIINRPALWIDDNGERCADQFQGRRDGFVELGLGRHVAIQLELQFGSPQDLEIRIDLEQAHRAVGDEAHLLVLRFESRKLPIPVTSQCRSQEDEDTKARVKPETDG